MNNTDSQNKDKLKFQSALLVKIVIAIILGIILGFLFKIIPFGEEFGRLLITLGKLFSNFLSFIVPLLVVGCCSGYWSFRKRCWKTITYYSCNSLYIHTIFWFWNLFCNKFNIPIYA